MNTPTVGKSRAAGMGARRDFGLGGANGKGDVPRTNTASKAYQSEWQRIFRPTPKRRKVTMSDKIIKAVAETVAQKDSAATWGQSYGL